MLDELSIPDLLSFLQIDHQNSAIRMAIESERLCRRHRYEDAITAAQNAVRTAGHNSGLQGVALLFLSAARFSTAMPDERHKSLRDCAHAVRTLATHTHNRAIAQIVRAKLEMEIDDKSKEIGAMEYWNAAEKTLQALIIDSHEHQRLNERMDYQRLLKFVREQAEQLHASLSEMDAFERKPFVRKGPTSTVSDEQPTTKPVQPNEVPSQQTTRQAASEKIKSKLPLPTRLIWPTSQPTRVELFPTGNKTKLDYIDASQLSLDGQPFILETVFPVSEHDKHVRLYAGKEYLIYRVEDKSNQRVLVRCQERLDQVQQIVVVEDQTVPRIWIDTAESDPPFTTIHILGDNRTWSIYDDASVKPHIVGVVEAIMTTIKSE